MVEMAGKEYLLKLREEQTRMKEEILMLLTEKEVLSFQEIYLEMKEQYHKYCPFPYERDQILEGILRNQLAVLVNRKELMEVSAETGAKYRLAGSGKGQKIIHAA